jgi:PEP-CTERM/exosortase A-associated glycosyltransferase
MNDNRMTRSLHILDHSIPLHSGYTFRTAALLRGQRELGWQTFHLTSPKQGSSSAPSEQIDGLTFHRTEPSTWALANYPVFREITLMNQLEQRIEQIAHEVRPDIIHAHSPVLNVLPAIKVARRLNIPVVYEIRAFWEDAAVDHGTTTENSIRYRLTKALETYAIRQVDHVFTICEGLRADIVSRGIPPEKVTVTPNAVDVEAFQLAEPPDAELQTQLGLDGKTVIGFVGSFYAYEGLDLLLDSFPSILAKEPNARILLVGGGPQEANLKQKATTLGIQEKVIFTGRVPHREVNRYYNLIDVLAYPRHSMRLTELVTPLKPLEAMAQGKIFVASDVGGHKELIDDGKTGFLFSAGQSDALANALTKALGNRQLWPSIIANGRKFVETERNWSNSVANYIQPYHQLTGKSCE